MDKKIVAVVVAAAGLCGCARVSAGYVGLKSTMVGTGRGMADVAVGPAWVGYNILTENVMEYPTFVQTAVWTQSKDEGKPTNEEITFTTKSSMQVSADISLAYHLEADKTPQFYIKFRTDDLEKFTHGFLRNLAREKFDSIAGKYEVEQIVGDNAEFLGAVRAALQAEVAAVGVRIDQFGFIGAPRPPKTLMNAINAKLQASQLAFQKQNEVKQAEADAQKNVAEAEGEAKAILTRAEAQAEANRKLAQSLTPSLIEYEKLQKWDGALPQVTGGGAGVLLNLGSK